MAGATVGELELLQKLMVQALTSRVQADMEDSIPTDAATLGVIAKLLKDNNVVADPADADDLKNLREKLQTQAAARRVKNSTLLSVVKAEAVG